MMCELASVLGFQPLAPGIDCHSWLAVHLEGGAELDACAVCGEPASGHPADAFGEEEADGA